MARLPALLAALLMAAGLAGCATRPQPAGLAAAPVTERIHLVRRGWHTEIAVVVEDLPAGLAALAAERPGTRHMLFGFGQRDYLLSVERGPLVSMRALFPGEGAMLVTWLPETPEAAYGAAAVIPLGITGAGLDRLRGFLAESFATDAAGAPIRLVWSGQRGAFYAAALPYSLGYTCNTWAAEALAQAGLPARVPGVVFAGQVMDQGHRLAEASLVASRGSAGPQPRPRRARSTGSRDPRAPASARARRWRIARAWNTPTGGARRRRGRG